MSAVGVAGNPMRLSRIPDCVRSPHGELKEASDMHMDTYKQQYKYVCFNLDLCHMLHICKGSVYI